MDQKHLSQMGFMGTLSLPLLKQIQMLGQKELV